MSKATEAAYEAQLLRLYAPHELGNDGYPVLWHRGPPVVAMMGDPGDTMAPPDPSIKDLVRELAGHRCIRCGHPYPPGIALKHPRGEWTPCDHDCTHGGEIRYRDLALDTDWREIDLKAPVGVTLDDEYPDGLRQRWEVEAHWRILTVHHLSGDKGDCRWWNLVALCQRCHLTIQGRVQLSRLYVHPHTDWFKPYAAGYYAFAYLNEELTRTEAVARLDDLLNLELDPSYRA